MACWNFPYNKIELHYSWTRFLSTWSFHCRPCLLAGISFSDNPTGLGSISPRFSGLYPSTRGFHRHKKCQTHPFDVPHIPHKLTQLLEKCKSSTSIHGDRVIGLVVRWSKHLNPNTYLYNLSSTMSFFYLKGLWLTIYLHCIIIHIYIYTIIYNQSSHISLSNSEMHAGCSSAHHDQSSILCWNQAQKNPWNQWNPYSCWVALGEFGWFFLIQSNCILLHPQLIGYVYIYYNGGLPPNHPF